MPFSWDDMPYTNFHELNLDWFINKFKEIFEEWESLYNQLTTWKDATDAELEAWKTAREADIEGWETATIAALDAWADQAEADIGTWETATIAALDTWKTAAEAAFEAIRVQAAASATAAAGSAMDAETAKTAAIAAQTAAETAAASVTASAAQITENMNDIAELKTQLNDVVPLPEFPLSKFGNEGEVLRTDGEGGTEWVPMGIPSEQEFEDIVNDWLDNHSGAYVVPDNSLTYEKLVAGTLGFVIPQMFGAKGDGLTDDTNAIQSCLDVSNFVYFPEGTYLVDPEITMGQYQTYETFRGVHPRSNTTIILNKNAVLKAKENKTSYYAVVSLEDVHDINIFGGKIEGSLSDPSEMPGSNAQGPFGHGIFIYARTGAPTFGCRNILIDGVEIYNCWGDGIIASGTYSTGNSYNIKITNCNVHNCRRMGISITRGSAIEIDSCYVHNISGYGSQSYCIDLESTNPNIISKHINVHDCTLDNVSEQWGLCCSSNWEDINITNCACISPINLYNAISTTIIGCDIPYIVLSKGKNIISDCRIGYIRANITNHTSIFNNCTINGCYDVTGTSSIDVAGIGYVIESSTYTTYEEAKLVFNSCYFDSPMKPSNSENNATRFYRLAAGLNNVSAKMNVEFNNCTFLMKNRDYFFTTSGVPAWFSMSINNCLMVFDSTTGALFNEITTLKLKNNEIKAQEINNFISISSSDRKLFYDICGNIIPKIKYGLINNSSSGGFATPSKVLFNNNIVFSDNGNMPTLVRATAASATVSNIELVGGNNTATTER